MNKFSERLKELRQDKGLSQKALAMVFSVNRRSISNWENATREPDLDTIIKIATYFEVTIDYLVGLVD